MIGAGSELQARRHGGGRRVRTARHPRPQQHTRLLDLARQVALQVREGAQLLGARVGERDGEDLPVQLALIDHGQRAQHADLAVARRVSSRRDRCRRRRCVRRACSTWPRGSTAPPTSTTSTGSLSPAKPVLASLWLGSSHVCGSAP